MSDGEPHDPDPPPKAAREAAPEVARAEPAAAPMGDPSPEPASASEAVRGLFGSRPMLFPNAYTWLLLFSALDIMLTWLILSRGGREVNAIAEWVIRRFELEGMIAYKFILVLVFVLICELVGRLQLSSGQTLSRVGVGISMIPVVWSIWLLFNHMA